MQVIEQFLAAKTGHEPDNEDFIAVYPGFIALFDGATSRGGDRLAGMSVGRFAARTLAEGIGRLDPGIDAFAAIDALNAHLHAATATARQADNISAGDEWSNPMSGMIVYSKHRREIWRIADPSFMVDGGAANMKDFQQELAWCDLRRSYVFAALARGVTEAELREHDPTWAILTPLIAHCKIFANHDGPYGYSVMNGKKIPESLIEVFDAKDAKEIIFASDGYPEVLQTLEQSEKRLRDIVTADPLLYRDHPKVKGMKHGWDSYDDRSYIRFHTA